MHNNFYNSRSKTFLTAINTQNHFFFENHKHHVTVVLKNTLKN